MKIEDLLLEIDIIHIKLNNYDAPLPSVNSISKVTRDKSKQLLSKISTKYLQLIDDCYPSLNRTLCVDFQNINNHELCLEIGNEYCGYFLDDNNNIFSKCVDNVNIKTEIDIDLAVKQIESDLFLIFNK